MYEDTIKVANKIISDKDLSEIFYSMYDLLDRNIKINKNEEPLNKDLYFKDQTWTFKDSNSKLTFNVDFYDNTTILFDNYNNFASIFESRKSEIKRIDVWFTLSYEIASPNMERKYYSQSIIMGIREDNISITVRLSSEDNKLNDVFNLIKQKILNAPVRYDFLIKNKTSIKTIYGLSIGFIPSIIMSTLLVFLDTTKETFISNPVLFPICSVLFAFLIGITITSRFMNNLYKNITPEKKFIGYTDKAIYKDDIDRYIELSEVLIGKNTKNLIDRKKILEYYKKSKTYILYEMIIVVFITILVWIF